MYRNLIRYGYVAAALTKERVFDKIDMDLASGEYWNIVEDIMQEYFDKLKQTELHLRLKIDKAPYIAIVLGSGLGNLANSIQNKLEIPYDQIPNFPKTTVPGHDGRLIFGQLGDRTLWP